jgi:adenylate cyclase
MSAPDPKRTLARHPLPSYARANSRPSWQDGVAEQGVKRKLAAIVAADIVGYSRLMEADEAGTLAQLKALRKELIDPKIAEHNGRIVKTTGDGLLIEFGSVTDAVTSSVEIQEALAQRNNSVPEDRRIQFRVGINVGEIIIEGDDIYGTGVNVAARLESIAEPGSICVSSSVYDQIGSILRLDFVDMGEQTVKNIAKPVRSYAVRVADGRGNGPGNSAPGTGPVSPQTERQSEIPSIAVLPFVSKSTDPEQEFFADGVTDDIITALSRLKGFFVISRNTMVAYKDTATDARKIARELGVRYVLEGSVRAAGNRVRVTAQLTDVAGGNQLWAEHYDRNLDDVFAIQDEITESVVGCLQPELYAAEYERLKRKPPQNLGAWECFVRGMFLYSQHTDTGTREALDMLRRAVELDDGYAQAHGMIAVTLTWRVMQGWEDPKSAVAEATEAASRAVACDPQEPWAYMGQGFVAPATRQNVEATNAFQRVIALSPNFAYAHGLLGATHALGGRGDEAIECIDRGIRLSPRDIFGEEYHLYYAFAHFQAGRYLDAGAAADRAIQQRPGHPVPYIMAAASYGLAEDAAKSKAAVKTLTSLVPGIKVAEIEKGFPYVLDEDRTRLADGLRQAGLR